MSKIELPLIDCFEAFKAFSEGVATSTKKTVSIFEVSTFRNQIYYNDVAMNLDEFLYNYIISNCNEGSIAEDKNSLVLGPITYGVDKLEDYDFSRLVYRMHPKEFLKYLDKMADHHIRMGNMSFNLWEFVVCKTEEGYELIKYCGNRCDDITVDIPDFITSIGEYAFESYKNLRHIVFPDNLKLIKSGAFKATGLEEVNIPDSVIWIGKDAFRLCRDLHYVKLSKNMKEISTGSFSSTGIEEIIFPDSLETMGEEAFYGTKLKKVVLPDSVQKIGNMAFASNAELSFIKFPKHLRELSDRIVQYDRTLRTIILPEDLKNIGNEAFSYTAIEEIVLPYTLEDIGEDIFARCVNLKKIMTPKQLMPKLKQYLSDTEVMILREAA